MESPYIDIKTHLQGLVDGICERYGFPDYEVTLERKLNATTDRKIVVSQLAGAVGELSVTIPYQFDVYANEPEEAMMLLSVLARENSMQTFTSTVEDSDGNAQFYVCVGSYNTPVITDKDVQIGANRGCRITQYVSFDCFPNVRGVTSVKYKGAEVPFVSVTPSFVAELNANNQNGKSLMKSVSTGASASVAIQFVPRDDSFTYDLDALWLGTRDKNLPFTLSFKFGNSGEVTRRFVCSTYTTTTTKGRIPTGNVNFVLYDEGD